MKKQSFWSWLAQALFKFFRSPEFEFIIPAPLAVLLTGLVFKFNSGFWPVVFLVWIAAFIVCAHAVYRNFVEEDKKV